jgi:hypothetical protein
MIGSEIGYVAVSLATGWIKETRELSRMLHGLISKISD